MMIEYDIEFGKFEPFFWVSADRIALFRHTPEPPPYGCFKLSLINVETGREISCTEFNEANEAHLTPRPMYVSGAKPGEQDICYLPPNFVLAPDRRHLAWCDQKSRMELACPDHILVAASLDGRRQHVWKQHRNNAIGNSTECMLVWLQDSRSLVTLLSSCCHGKNTVDKLTLYHFDKKEREIALKTERTKDNYLALGTSEKGDVIIIRYQFLNPFRPCIFAELSRISLLGIKAYLNNFLVKLPIEAKLMYACLSESGERIAWLLKPIRSSLPKTEAEKNDSNEIWVSKLDGDEMQKIDSFPVGSLAWPAMQWTIDENQLSFLYKNRLAAIDLDS